MSLGGVIALRICLLHFVDGLPVHNTLHAVQNDQCRMLAVSMLISVS